MNSNLTELKQKFENNLLNANDEASVEALRLEFLGKKGYFTDIMKVMPSLSPEDKKTFGADVNVLKNLVEEKIAAKKTEIENAIIEKEISEFAEIDFSLPTEAVSGSLHPITITQQEIEEIFKQMGFIIEDGNEIETEFNNFEALNIPKHHPARDMQDTFWLDNGQLLKTHTSASQNRIMKKYGAPLKVLFPGRCFRNEAVDASHETTFFQLEGMMIGEDVNISTLLYFMETLLKQVLKRDLKVRLRPGFFPFVEPGFELDINCAICGGNGCSTCKQSGWVELLPCGMIHPNVLKMGGIDTEKYRGFAFGLGLTRLSMMRYEIKNIRVLNSGNLKVLSQFGTKVYDKKEGK